MAKSFWCIILLTAYVLVAAENQQCDTITDMALVIDSSSSIWPPNFDKQIKFIQNVVKKFVIGPDHTQIAALTFSDRISYQFLFDSFDNSQEVLQRIGEIEHDKGGSTYTDKALTAAHEVLFSQKSGSRPDVSRVCLLLTDGNSDNKKATFEAARKMKDDGIRLVAVGVGNAVNKEELLQIVSEPDDYIAVPTFGQLQDTHTANIVGKQVCKVTTTTTPTTTTSPTTTTTTPTTTTTTPTTTTTTPTTTTSAATTTTPMMKDEPDKECQGKAADVVFAIDSSSSIWPVDFDKQLKFINDVTSHFDINSGKTQVGMVVYSDDARVEFFLNKHRTYEKLSPAVSKIKYTGGITNAHLALKLVNDVVLKTENGARPDVGHICILITDGRSSKPQSTKEESIRLHNNGVYVFAIGVGNNTDKSELDMIASKPTSQYSFEVKDGYGALAKIKNILAYKTCKVPAQEARCVEDVQADIMFGLYNIGGDDSADVLQFIQKFGSRFNLDTNVRIGVRQGCPDVMVDLASFPDSKTYVSKLNDVLTTGISELLASCRSGLRSSRPDANRVAIVIVSGPIPDAEKAYLEALRLKYNTRVIIVGIGESVSVDDMKKLASSKNGYEQDSSHVFLVTSAGKLADLIKKIQVLICKEQ